jgi:OFA family oxalate/formate antiporter-like MFS transporter
MKNMNHEEDKMDYTKKRWLILSASCLVALCVGSLYAWSVFASPMAEYLEGITNKKIPSLAIIFTVSNSVGPITMIGGGYLNDKLGPKLVLLIGGVLFGLGMIGSGFATSVPMLIVTYGLGVGLGVGMVYGTVVANAVKFFPDKSGLAGGLTTACYGGSSIIVPMIATLLLENYSITTAFKILGIVMLIVICVSTLVVEACPKDYTIGKQKNVSEKTQKATPVREYNYKEMLCSKEFYYMLIILMCGAFAGMMIISQASPIAQNLMGYAPAAAAAVVSILALFNMLGRIVIWYFIRQAWRT